MATLQRLKMSALRESPFNYRTKFSDEGLQEMADSIKAIGIQQPPKARHIPEGQADIEVTHEIVFGHRRYRDALIAGLEEIDVLVEDMTDEQVRIAQLSENIQREDTTALEEAEGLNALVKIHRVPVEQLIKETGKSKSHIYNTLRLVRLNDECREALEKGSINGGIDREVAVLIAAFPPSLHSKALLHVTTYGAEGRKALSYREAKRALNEKMYVSIKSAPFDIEDADLCKARGACSTCPHLAKNDPGLIDKLDDDTCTDTHCFSSKVKEHNRAAVDQARARGQDVIEGEAAKEVDISSDGSFFKGFQTADHKMNDHTGKWRSVKQIAKDMKAEGVEPPKTTLLLSEARGTTHELVSRDELQKVHDYLQSKRPASAASAREEDVFTSPEHEAAYKLSSQIKTAASREALKREQRSTLDLRAIAASMLFSETELHEDLVDHFGWREEMEAADVGTYVESDWVIENKLLAMGADDLARLITFLALHNIPPFSGKQQCAEFLLSTARDYAIDLEMLSASTSGEAHQAVDEDEDEEEQADEAHG